MDYAQWKRESQFSTHNECNSRQNLQDAVGSLVHVLFRV